MTAALSQALLAHRGAALALVVYLVATLWVGVLAVAVAAVVVRSWRTLDAAARYGVWYAALLVVAVAPAIVATMTVSAAIGHVASGTNAAATTVNRPAEPPRPLAPVVIPAPLVYGVAGAWLLVVLAGALRLVAGTFVLTRLKRDALPLAPERRDALPLWRAHAGSARTRAARLCVSERIDVPVAVGLFDGMVVVPRQVADDFPSGDVDRFVLHELAHLERRDDWTILVQRMVQTALFFNPAVHLIARRLDLEREIACDDRVVAATGDVRTYAVGLTRMAEATAWPHRGIAAPAIFVTRKQLSLRVEQLLAHRPAVRRRAALIPIAVALFASAAAVMAAGSAVPAFALAGSSPSHANRHGVALMIVERDGSQMTVDVDRSAMLVLTGDPHDRRMRKLLLPGPNGTTALSRAVLDQITADRATRIRFVKPPRVTLSPKSSP